MPHGCVSRRLARPYAVVLALLGVFAAGCTGTTAPTGADATATSSTGAWTTPGRSITSESSDPADPGGATTAPGATATATATGYPGGGVLSEPQARACAATVFTGMSDAERLGQLLMVGIHPNQAPGGMDATIRSRRVGSVIYLGGWSGAATVRSTSAHLQQVATGPADLLIAADQEGGAVQQLKGAGFTVLPSALRQGRLGDGAVSALGEGIGRELSAAGVNVNLAPVADTVPLDRAKSNAPIGKHDRQLGSDPTVVSHAVPLLVTAIQSRGVIATVKHFPGLGRVTGNTDVTASGITDSVATVHDPFLAPFRAGIDAGVGLVMVSSARYPGLDPDNQAVFSRAIVTDLLRGQLGYDGVVVTDDVGVAAAVAAVPVGQRAVRFLAAGGDLVLTASAAQAPTMLAEIRARADSDAAFHASIDESIRRVLTLKARFGLVRCG